MAGFSLPGRTNRDGPVQPQDQFVNDDFGSRELRLPHGYFRFGARYSDGKKFLEQRRNVLMQVDDKIVVQDCML